MKFTAVGDGGLEFQLKFPNGDFLALQSAAKPYCVHPSSEPSKYPFSVCTGDGSSLAVFGGIDTIMDDNGRLLMSNSGKFVHLQASPGGGEWEPPGQSDHTQYLCFDWNTCLVQAADGKWDVKGTGDGFSRHALDASNFTLKSVNASKYLMYDKEGKLANLIRPGDSRGVFTEYSSGHKILVGIDSKGDFSRVNYDFNSRTLELIGGGEPLITSVRLCDDPSGHDLFSPRWEDPGKWMSNLPDSARLQDLTIPGTHESGSLESKNTRYDYWQCQDKDIPWQLNNGVRYLDLRASGSNLRIVHGSKADHGVKEMPDTFGSILGQIKSFLSGHPTETVLVRMRRENNDITDGQFVSTFNSIVAQCNASGLLYQKNEIPKISEVRGKIVILSDVGGLDGIRWPGGGSGTRSNDKMIVQDFYDDLTINAKFDHVSTFAKRANQQSEKTQLYVNHLSANASSHDGHLSALSPLNYANGWGDDVTTKMEHGMLYRTNHAISDWNNSFGKASLGIFAMDYPGYSGESGPALIRGLINWNRRLFG
ncbi:phosphatidylinositol-specific phospholipase C domain-containing protein [Streptomyces sp. KLMMK]